MFYFFDRPFDRRSTEFYDFKNINGWKILDFFFQHKKINFNNFKLAKMSKKFENKKWTFMGKTFGWIPRIFWWRLVFFFLDELLKYWKIAQCITEKTLETMDRLREINQKLDAASKRYFSSKLRFLGLQPSNIHETVRRTFYLLLYPYIYILEYVWSLMDIA